MNSAAPLAGERRIRVCAVIQSFSPVVGGAQLQLERMAPRLAEHGIELTILTKAYHRPPHRTDGPRRRPRVESIPGATIRRLGIAGASPPASFVFIVSSLVYVLLRRRRIDIVHAYGALSEGIVALGASLAGLPTIVRVLRTGPLGDLDRLRSKPGARQRWRLLAARTCFIALSAEGREELLDAGVPASRIFQIPNGVDTATFHPATTVEQLAARDALGLPAEATIAVFVGRLTPEKQVDILVRAAAGVVGLTLVVVGDGWERIELERLAAELPPGTVRFAGDTESVADYLRAADIFCLPSRSEGMSNSLLEAMACGLACLASAVSGVPELLAEGRGEIIPNGDAATWRLRLEELVRDEAKRRELGAAAAAYVEQRLTLTRAADATAAAYGAVTAP